MVEIMSDGKLIAGLCLKVPLCSEDMSSLFSYTEKIRADGFQAGAASRDAEIERLEKQSVILRATIKCHEHWQEKCDQLREQVALLREALKEAVEDYSDRFDMSSPSTNPGIKTVVKQGKEALAATEPE